MTLPRDRCGALESPSQQPAEQTTSARGHIAQTMPLYPSIQDIHISTSLLPPQELPDALIGSVLYVTQALSCGCFRCNATAAGRAECASAIAAAGRGRSWLKCVEHPATWMQLLLRLEGKVRSECHSARCGAVYGAAVLAGMLAAASLCAMPAWPLQYCITSPNLPSALLSSPPRFLPACSALQVAQRHCR